MGQFWVSQVALEDSAQQIALRLLRSLDVFVLDAEVVPLRRLDVAVADALATTTAKGIAFEVEVLPTIQCWAKYAGGTVAHVGGDRQPGDIVVTVSDPALGTDEFMIVIECRDDRTARGRKRVSDDIAAAMKARKAQAGVYISKTPAGLAKEIGDWSEGKCSQGPFIACVSAHVVTALRFTVVAARIRAFLAAKPEADTSAIRQEVHRIRTATRRIRNIKAKAADIEKGADCITQEAAELQQEIGDALAAIESALRSPAQVAA